MRAFVITGPGAAEVREVPVPEPGAGEVVVDVKLAGVCGTDEEFWTGDMAYLHAGHASYPLRPGHEWTGNITELGPGVAADWRGKRVTGDTMLGCGDCARCRAGKHHVCSRRFEVGIRGGFPGALAEKIVMPIHALHEIPAAVDDVAAALVEPGGNALRAALACDPQPGKRVLIWGPGTIGLLTAMFLRARDVEVHLVGRTPASLDFARELGFETAVSADQIPHSRYDAVVDATNGPNVPPTALSHVEPAGRLVLIGLAGVPTKIDTRDLVYNDITAMGILSGSPGLAGAIADYASGAVDPRPLVAATVALNEVGAVLNGTRPATAGAGPKILVDPQRSEK